MKEFIFIILVIISVAITLWSVVFIKVIENNTKAIWGVANKIKALDIGLDIGTITGTVDRIQIRVSEGCEDDGMIYTSSPGQRKCKYCDKMWYPSREEAPSCDK